MYIINSILAKEGLEGKENSVLRGGGGGKGGDR